MSKKKNVAPDSGSLKKPATSCNYELSIATYCNIMCIASNSSALDGSPLMYKFVGSMVWGSTGLKPFTRDTSENCKW